MKKGQHLILYDEDKNKILEGPIIEVTSGSIAYVEYHGAKKFDYCGTHGNALVVANGHMTEYRAKIGVMYNKNQVEIGLSNAEARTDGRGATRYPVDVSYVVKHIYIGARRIPIPNPIEIKIKDISSTGMMFVSSPNFNIKTRIGYSLWTSDTERVSTVAQIVRSENLGNGLVRYGCRFENVLST